MTHDLLEDLPRGDFQRRAKYDATPGAQWRPLHEIVADQDLTYDPDNPGKKILLGAIGERFIGIDDDRHMMTVAGSRAGKGVSAIIPNLLAYRGSVLAIDPKGELACITAAYRKEGLGQEVHILDPFGRLADVKWARHYRAAYNPMTILTGPDGTLGETAVEDAGLIADALVVAGEKDVHWDDAARNFIEGLILHVASYELHWDDANLVRVRELLMEGAMRLDKDGNQVTDMGGLRQQMEEGARRLREANEDAADAISFAAADFFEKPENERGSVLSTARRHTKFLDFGAIKDVLRGHRFDLTDLKTEERGVTIYLCLPITRLASCARWFRLFVNLALDAMERVKGKPPVPVLMVLDEFAALERMVQVEKAAGQIAGFGVKLWPILQDLTQLQTKYKDAWETFVGNAGVLQFFGNNDVTTLEYIEKRLGQTTLAVEQRAQVSPEQQRAGATGKSYAPQVQSLMTAEEAGRFFARDDDKQRQLIIRAAKTPPMVLQRVIYHEHPAYTFKYEKCENFGNE
jgi:type IV secretion system protein VirD4